MLNRHFFPQKEKKEAGRECEIEGGREGWREKEERCEEKKLVNKHSYNQL